MPGYGHIPVFFSKISHKIKGKYEENTMKFIFQFFSQNDTKFIISSSVWMLIFLVIALLGMVIIYLNQKNIKFNEFTRSKLWLQFVFKIMIKPCLFLLSLYGLYFIASIYFTFKKQIYFSVMDLNTILNLLECVGFFWLLFNTIKITNEYLIITADENNYKTLGIILPAISSSIYAIIFLIMINIIIPEIDLSTTSEFVLERFSKVLLISMSGWVIIQIANACEKFIINQYILNNQNLFNVRKIHTQLTLLKRIFITLIIVITISSVLMLFDGVKNLGTGLLTTAGIISAIGAFASQQSLSRLFAGLLIAFTQPIRIGDTIIIDNELGQVEEISLSFIVIKLWDLRRLILPTDYFTNKGLQNLTRDSSELLGTTYFYTDYTLPVDVMRSKFFEFLHASNLWDKKIASFHVTDIKQNCMEIRGLMSAENSSKLWELRCQIREQLIHFIVENFPECLSKSRHITIKR